MSFTNEVILNLLTLFYERFILLRETVTKKYLLDLPESGQMRDNWTFRAGCIQQNHFKLDTCESGPKKKTLGIPGTGIYLISNRIGFGADKNYVFINRCLK